MSARNLLAIAAALLVIALTAHWLGSLGGNANLAFAEVQARVEKARSVQYTQTRKDTSKNGTVAPQESRKVMILDGHRKRAEIRMTTHGDPLPEGERWTSSPAP